MRRLNKRKTAIILIVMIMLLVEIIILGLSRANNIKEIHTTIIDYGEKLEDDNLILDAINSGKDSYYVVLPDMINNKVVTSYYVALRNDGQSEETTATENAVSNEINIDEEAQINTVVEDTSNTETNLETTKQVQMEKKPGDKLYLTATEIEEQKLNVIAKYDEKEKNGQLLYNKHLEQIIDDKNVTVEGYMPADAILTVAVANEEKTKEALKDVLNKDITYKIAYDIKLLSNEKEYNPTDFDENVKVSISGVDAIDKENQKYKVVHINNENKIEEIEKIELKDNEVVFDASSFSTYALLLDDTMNLTNMAMRANVAPRTLDNAMTDTWDGTTAATSFKYGDGTAASPYLIQSCAELALFRNNVNTGTTYSGQYFQLVRNLDLNGNYWTPIGITEKPFQGIFDGAGYTISNAKIAIAALTTSIDSYGFFGSIGGGTSKAEVRNVMFDSISIQITASGNTATTTTQKGYHIGIIVGTLYKNANILNNSITNCSITAGSTLTLANNSFRVAVGGVAGFVANGFTKNKNGITISETDPGSTARYSIKSCFADVNINIGTKCADETSAGQYAVGGIVGIIRSQPVWPDHCMYNGSITANGFIGPIFGYLRNSTNYTSTSNYLTLWQGNDAGNLTMTSAYSAPITINGTSINGTVTTGSSTNNIAASVGKGATVIQSVQGTNKGIAYTETTDNISLLNGGGLSTNTYLPWTTGYTITSNFTSVTVANKTTSTYDIDAKNTKTPLTYKWYVNGTLQTETSNVLTKTSSWEEAYEIDSIIKDNNGFYYLQSFEIPKLELKITFNIDEAKAKTTAELTGTAKDLINLEDYTYQWYKLDVSGITATEIKGETLAILTQLVEGQEYKLVATNTNNAELSREGSFIYKGNRTVIYVDYAEG